MLFDSLVRSDPKHPLPGWIAAAALEEHAGRMVAARKIIKQGCEQCPKSEDVWLEAAILHVRILVLSFFLFLFPLMVDLRTKRCEVGVGECCPACWAECQDLARSC